MNDQDGPVFLDDYDGELIDPTKALCVLREHLSETIGLSDITKLIKE